MNHLNLNHRLNDATLFHEPNEQLCKQNREVHESVKALTAAALVLPGLMSASAHAAEDDQTSFGYQYYQEGERTRAYLPGYEDSLGPHTEKKPITVESFGGKARISLSDRVKFAFNYLQDTWGGATPIMTGVRRQLPCPVWRRLS